MMMARSTERGDVSGPVGLGSVVRSLALVGATLTTGLISGFFYAYACSVTRGLALLPDAQYVAAMQAINATVRNGVFAFSFFGAALFLILAVVVHVPRLRSRRFVLISLACPLYVAGGFVLTLGVNVPMNEGWPGWARTRLPRFWRVQGKPTKTRGTFGTGCAPYARRWRCSRS